MTLNRGEGNPAIDEQTNSSRQQMASSAILSGRPRWTRVRYFGHKGALQGGIAELRRIRGGRARSMATVWPCHLHTVV